VLNKKARAKLLADAWRREINRDLVLKAVINYDVLLVRFITIIIICFYKSYPFVGFKILIKIKYLVNIFISSIVIFFNTLFSIKH
jgi:hypothetical protein